MKLENFGTNEGWIRAGIEPWQFLCLRRNKMSKTVRHMETKLSTKGQLVVPRLARQKLALRAGTVFECRIAKGSLIFTPKAARQGNARLVRDAETGLMITRISDPSFLVTSEQVRAALADFP